MRNAMRRPVRATTRRSLLAVLFLSLSLSAWAQVNDKGVVHLAIGLAAGGHATEYEQTVTFLGIPITTTTNDGAATWTVPLEVSYGLARVFSLGIYAEPGAYLDSSATESNAIIMLGIQPRFYLINQDRFAWMASLRLGATNLTIDRSEPGLETSSRYRGSHFGLSTGVAFQFSDLLGLHLHLQYLTNRMPLKEYELNGSSIDLANIEAELRTQGVTLQASVAFRF